MCNRRVSGVSIVRSRRSQSDLNQLHFLDVELETKTGQELTQVYPVKYYKV